MPAPASRHQLIGYHHVQLAMPPGEEPRAEAFYSGLLGLPRVENTGFHLFFMLVGIASASTQREWFHKLQTAAMACAFGLYIALLFTQLH